MKKTLIALVAGTLMLAPLASYADAPNLTPDQYTIIQTMLNLLEQELLLLQQEVAQLAEQQSSLTNQLQSVQHGGGGGNFNHTTTVKDTPAPTPPAPTPALAVTTQSAAATSILGSQIGNIGGDYTLVLAVKAGDADVYVPKDGIDAAPAGGQQPYDGTQSLTVTSDASDQGDYWLIPAGSTATFTVHDVMTLNQGASGTYELDATAIRYNATASPDGMQTIAFFAGTNGMLLATVAAQ